MQIMNTLYLVLLLSVLFLNACEDKQEHTNISKLHSSPSLRITPRTCDYGQHHYARFQCFYAEQKIGLKHKYNVTVIEPNMDTSHDWSSMIVSIPGGPGQGDQTSAAWVSHWASWMEKADLTQPLLLFEPFGTKGSSTFWQCDEYDRLSLKLTASAITLEDELLLSDSVLKQCVLEFDQLLKTKFELDNGVSQINSQANAAGLKLLLDSLPAKKIHLLGTSYGTRVALLAADHDRVATIVLDSPYPFKRGTIVDWPDLLGRAFALHESQYQKSKTDSRYQNQDLALIQDASIAETSSYKALLSEAYQFLTVNPQQWRLERWDGREAITLSLTADRLLALHYHVLYDETLLPYFYKSLQNIRSRPDELRWLLEDFVTNVFDPSFSTFIYLAVECNDNRKVSRDTFIARAKLSQDTYTNWPSMYDMDSCHYGVFDQSSPIQAEEYVQKPTIILSGELDPVTPMEWGAEMHQVLTDSELYIRAGVGHAVLSSEQCLLPRLRHFWASKPELNQQPQLEVDSIQYQRFLEACASR